jgi:hypothetical protein
MLETYPATIRDNQIEWDAEPPKDLGSGQSIRVHVTLLEKVAAVPTSEQGQRMAAALERLAANGTGVGPADPAAWERESREDRPLPGRDA